MSDCPPRARVGEARRRPRRRAARRSARRTPRRCARERCAAPSGRAARAWRRRSSARRSAATTHDAVEIARVVDGQHARAAGRHVLQPAHGERHAGEAQEQRAPCVRRTARPGPGAAGARRRSRRTRPSRRAGRAPRRRRPCRAAARSVRRACGRSAAPREAHDLQPDRAPLDLAAALVELAARGAPDLAAGGLQHGARRREHDVVRRHADQRHREVVDAGLAAPRAARDPVSRVSASTTTRSVPARASRLPNTATQPRADAFEAADRLLELVGMDVAAGADDHVLDAAGDVDLACRDVAVVAGVHPLAVQQSRASPPGCGSSRWWPTAR